MNKEELDSLIERSNVHANKMYRVRVYDDEQKKNIEVDYKFIGRTNSWAVGEGDKLQHHVDAKLESPSGEVIYRPLKDVVTHFEKSM